MIKHILWDWNGTLLDDLTLCVEATNVILKTKNFPLIDEEFYRKNFCFPVSKFYKKLGLDIVKEYDIMCYLWINYYKENFLGKTCLNKGAKKILELAHQKGIKQTIISACENNLLQLCLKKFEIAPFFKGTYGNTNLKAHGKMDLAQEVIMNLNLPSCEVLLVGDSYHDYQIAQKFNLKCVLLKEGFFEGHCPNSFKAIKIEKLIQVEKLI